MLICLFLLEFSSSKDSKHTVKAKAKATKRLYTHQFDQKYIHIDIKPIILFTIYMGKLKYRHLPLLLESMRYNPKVQFTLLNIVENKIDSDHVFEIKKQMQIDNFVVHSITLPEFSHIVNTKLGLNVNMTSSWYYKLSDYKPALGYLFSELCTDNFKYWGFADMDVIWYLFILCRVSVTS